MQNKRDNLEKNQKNQNKKMDTTVAAAAAAKYQQSANIKSSFDIAYEQAVVESMSVLGKNIMEIVNRYIKEKYSIHLTDTANNPKALSDALDFSIDGGARIIKRRIIRSLYDKIGIRYPFIIKDFESTIFEARKEFEKMYK